MYKRAPGTVGAPGRKMYVVCFGDIVRLVTPDKETAEKYALRGVRLDSRTGTAGMRKSPSGRTRFQYQNPTTGRWILSKYTLSEINEVSGG